MARKAPRGAPWPRAVVAPLTFALVALGVWWLASAPAPDFLLPSPADVIARLIRDLTGPTMWPYLGTTVAEAVGGSALGAAVALPLAIAIHRSAWIDAALSPFLGGTQAIPAIALAPLLVLWVGYGLGAIVLLCALMVFFPILISTVVGLRHIDEDVVAAAQLDGASSPAILRHIELPLALPMLLAGLRNGFTLSITGAVVGEMVMGGRGLGTLLTVQRDAVDTAGMFSVIAILCALAAGTYSLLRLAERRSLTSAPPRRTVSLEGPR